MSRDGRKYRKWQRFSSCGEPISSTPFVAFKVPIHNSIESIPFNDRFTFEDVFRLYPNIGLVIDLTNTTKYYNPVVLTRYGAIYVKIALSGHGTLPHSQDIQEFNRIVDHFLRTSRNQLIGVHCTHGVNRTGFMICQYMITRFAVSAQIAINTFEIARHHSIERQSYIDALCRMDHSSRYNRNGFDRGTVFQNNNYQPIRQYRHM